MVRIQGKITEKIERACRWEKENPGLSWCSPEYPEGEGKIYITHELRNSMAYRSLSRVAMLLYQDFLAKREMVQNKRNKKKVWVITNNGNIIYPYSEALKMGFSKQQFVNSIDELQEKGLIDITHQGKGGRKPAKGTGDVSTYWIDDR